jgi:HAE1 family hydrophobic/amphiphilic exporter-1
VIRLSIRRPVAVTMVYGAVAAMGAFAWRNIPIELIPDTNLPRLTVTGSWVGASPETVEAFLTSPLEATIQQIKGVEKITSTSTEGFTSIQVDFGRDVDMDFARLDLSERIATLEEDLPPDVRGVTVQKYVPRELEEQLTPFLSYQLTGPYTLEALRAHLDDVVQPALTEIEGVGLVNVFGGRERRLEVRVDPEASRSLGLSPDVLSRRIGELDLVREAGVVREGSREWTVTIANRPASAQDVLDAVVATVDGRLVRVSDVASVSDTYEEATGYNRIDGRPAVRVDVIKEIGTNTVDVADRVKARMAELEPLVPYGSSYILLEDESEDIRARFTDLETRAAAAAVVIFLVLLAFLRSFASALVVFSTIGFSVLITLNLVYGGGFSLNLLTLMGLAMGFGLLVDNCIVVLENVYRRWRAGEDPGTAAEQGSSEVVLPILASTATNLIVFLPFVYMQGDMRLFYVPLAIVVGLSQIASLVVGFTFIPSLSARLLRGRQRGTPPAEPAAPAARRLPLYMRFYAAVVGWTLRNPWVTVTVAAAMFGGSWWLFDRYVTRGVVWGGGFGAQETMITVNVALPRGSSLERTDELVRFFEQKLATMPEVERYTSQVNATPIRSDARIMITFPDSLETTFIPLAVKEEMFAFSTTFTGADVRVYGTGAAFSNSFYGGGGGAPNYAIEVFGYNYEKVREIAEDLGGRFERMTRIEEVDTNASGRYTVDRATEYTVRVDRDALARYDISVQDLAFRLQAAVGGAAGMSWVKLGGDEVQYRVKLEGNEQADVLALQSTLFTLPDGRQVRLGDVVTVTPRSVLASVLRENQQYKRTVAYEFRGPVKLGDAVRDAVLDRTELPPGYSIKPAAGFGLRVEDRRQIYLVLAVSLLLIYMVTAAVFESFRLPLCVLLAIPMGLIGTFLTFFYTNATFTREAYIGVIMAGGIVVNNAILLVDHVNKLRARPDVALEDAALQGTLERVRPILMTSATTVLGMLPLVLFSGSNDNIWNALAFTLIGGMISSTVLVLTVTPALYVLFERRAAARAVVAPIPQLATAGD